MPLDMQMLHLLMCMQAWTSMTSKTKQGAKIMRDIDRYLVNTCSA